MATVVFPAFTEYGEEFSVPASPDFEVGDLVQDFWASDYPGEQALLTYARNLERVLPPQDCGLDRVAYWLRFVQGLGGTVTFDLSGLSRSGRRQLGELVNLVYRETCGLLADQLHGTGTRHLRQPALRELLNDMRLIEDTGLLAEFRGTSFLGFLNESLED